MRLRRPSRPWGLVAASALVAVVLVAPLVFLLVEAAGAGWSTVSQLIFRSLTAHLLWNTVRLMVVVTLGTTVVGTTAAWFVERTDLPLRRVWAVLVVVPLAIPDFVVSWGWASLSTWVSDFRGAVLVMILATYPLVYLPVAAAFRDADPGQEEVARSLGVGRVRTFWRITLGQARGAMLGGAVLVALMVLAEFGAFEVLGYQTFTTEIFTEFGNVYSINAACALSLVLVVIGLVVVLGDHVGRGRGRASRSGPGAQRRSAPRRLGRAKWPVFAGFVVLVGLALGQPIGSSIYWIFGGGASTITGVSLVSAALHTFGYGFGAGLLATLAALPVALLAVRHPSRLHHLLERTTFLVLAMPGIVIALSLAYFSEHYAGGFAYQRTPMLLVAYAILFFPLALVGVRASVLQAPRHLEDIARSLGRGRLTVARRVTLPLVGPGLAAAFCLVFLSVVTELTATLILIPTGVQTLATQFWSYQTNLSYGQAAPFALVMIGVAAVPSYILGRYFDRLPSRATVSTDASGAAGGTGFVPGGAELTAGAGGAPAVPVAAGVAV
jgi:iron(III) transport system permease protein